MAGAHMSNVVISLSTIPPRFGQIGPTLDSLLNQTAEISEIRLNIPPNYRRFPDWDGTLPDVPSGIRICRVPEDLGPATKILPTAHDLRGQDCEIFFGDDDRVYDPECIALLLKERRRKPDAAICNAFMFVEDVDPRALPNMTYPRASSYMDKPLSYRLLRIWHALTGKAFRKGYKKPRYPVVLEGYCDMLQGFGGVMVRPEMFDDETFNIPNVAWAVDDIWLSGALARGGVPIWVRASIEDLEVTDANYSDPLYEAVIHGADRPTSNTDCTRYLQKAYGIWSENLPKR